MHRHISLFLIVGFISTIWPSAICLGGGGAKNVLLVINENSALSQSIGSYYQQNRGIPERNVCRVTCSTDEYVSGSECETNVVAPIRSFIESSGLHDRLDYIVLTKGIPLKAGYDNAGFYGPLSVASVLACVGEASITGPIVNPYGPTASPAAPEQYFSHQLNLGGRHFYAVTRLDAYSEADVRRMIDDSLIAQPAPGLFLFDGADVTGPLYVMANDRLRQANSALLAAGYDTYYDDLTFDEKIREFVGGQSGVMGYFSWGSLEYTFTQEAYVSNQFIPGSIADTFVSYSGRTFTYPPSPGQSLIADLIPQGLSAGNGYVSEPFASLATYPNVLFDRYLRGYNLAESFMAANPELYWKSVVIGDPLMAPYATPPAVTITSPNPELVLHGTVEVAATATDASGIQKVEFYIDDDLIATRTTPPYQFTWDTSGYPDGTHVLEAIAYEDSPVFTQGIAETDVLVMNAVLDVSSMGLLGSVAEGTLVRLAEKPVVAGSDAFTDCLYIAEPDRSAGVKVVGPVQAMTGAIVTVVGEKRTINGETVFVGSSLVVHVGSSVPPPLGMPNLYVGNQGTHTGPPYSALRAGLSSSGLLVKTWGYVVQASEHEFYISDGTIATSGGSETRMKVSLENLVRPIPARASGGYVAVTGISTYCWDGDVLKPMLRPRFNSDIASGLALWFSTMTAPSGTLRAGWNLLSVPGMPVNPAPDSVLGGIEIDGRVFCWDPIIGGVVMYDAFQPELFPRLHVGAGFWLLASSPSDLVVEVVGNNQPDVDMWVSLPGQGFSLIGHTFNYSTEADNCFVSDGTRVISIEEAVNNGWMNAVLYYWDNSSSGLCTIDIGFEGVNDLEPWRGYWVKTSRPNLALIIPR